MDDDSIAVILAAGLGSRLRPETADRPKLLLEVGPRRETVLELLAKQCRIAGLRELTIVTGHGHDQVCNFLAAWAPPLPTSTVYNPDYRSMNNGRSLQILRPRLEHRSFVKFDGDLVLHPDLLPRLMAAPCPSAIILDDEVELFDEDMKASIDPVTGQVLALGKWLESSASGLSIGVERISAPDSSIVFDALDRMIDIEGEAGGYYEDAYHRVLTSGLWMGHVRTGGLPWVEIDTAEDLAAARALVGRLKVREDTGLVP